MRPEVKIFIKAFAALAALTLTTAGISLINLGWGNFVVAMTIAYIKATLVALFFMHLHRAKITVKVFALGGLFWFLTLILLSFNDYISRTWSMGSSIWMH